MIDLYKAKKAFQEYVSHYDVSVPSIRLKIVHTYKVMEVSELLCDELQLSKEDKDLASLIALLHDIGRFEQWTQYQSFADHKTVDHALFSSQLLFQEGLIRSFVDDTDDDEIIRIAIEQHNKYKIDHGFEKRQLLFIHLIRDADKLDNFRVKEEEKIEDILFVSMEEMNQSLITPIIYEQMYRQELIYAPNRQTTLDMWLSYIAFIFDLYFPQSLEYIRKNHWIDRSFDRIHPQDLQTYQQYQILKQRTEEYVFQKGTSL